MQKTARLLLLLLAATLARSAAGGPVAIFNLGTLPGGTESGGTSINASGQVTGFADTPTGQRAFRFDPAPTGGGTLRDLGTLGGATSTGVAINDHGQVTGESVTSNSLATRGFLYDGTPGAGGAMHDLGLFSGATSLSPSAINSANDIAGAAQTPAGQRAFHFLGVPGPEQLLEPLPLLGGSASGASGINDNGEITGWSYTVGDGQSHAFRYDINPGDIADLGTLGGLSSGGADINSSSQITGWSDDAAGNELAFRYDGTPGIDGVMHALSSLDPVDEFCRGTAINDAGVIVGDCSRNERSVSRPVLWRTDGSVVDLDAWLDQVAPQLGAKWTLLDARDINNAGLITGLGEFNDGVTSGTRAYVLDASNLTTAIPLPSPLAAGAALIVFAAAGARAARLKAWPAA